MNPADLEHRARLREALALIGHDPGEDVSLRELVIRTARVVKDHAPSILEQQNRARHRALPAPSDLPDPWRLNGRVRIYDFAKGTWSQPVLIVDRDLDASGRPNRILLHMRSIALYIKADGLYAQAGGGGTSFAIPEDADPASVMHLIDPERAFKGEYKVYGTTHYVAGASRNVLVRARNKKELALMYARVTGHPLNSSDLREFTETGNEAALKAFTLPSNHRQVLVDISDSPTPEYVWYASATSGTRL